MISQMFTSLNNLALFRISDNFWVLLWTYDYAISPVFPLDLSEATYI